MKKGKENRHQREIFLICFFPPTFQAEEKGNSYFIFSSRALGTDKNKELQ